MTIIETRCWVQKPVGGYYKDCLAILRVEYQTWVQILVLSLLFGFIFCFIYTKIKKINLSQRGYIAKSLIFSLIVLIIILSLRYLYLKMIIY